MTGPPPGGQDLTLALLATRLRTLTSQVTGLQGRLEDTESTVAGHTVAMAQVTELAQEVDRLAQLITGRSPAAGRAEPRAHPRIWAAMDDGQSADALRDLARWVTEILLAGHPHVARVLPPCWPGHAAVVEELDWLYWSWEEWATDPQARSQDAADWHDRWLPGVLARITPLLAPCAHCDRHVTPEYHRPEHAGYQCPEGTPAKDHHPELDFIERMGRAERAKHLTVDAFPA
jgi:hypothetical protein